MEEKNNLASTESKAIIPQESPKEVLKPRTYSHPNKDKPLTKRQLEIFTLFESGLKIQQIAEKLGVHPSYIGNTLHNYADRYRCMNQFHKLNGISILNAKIDEKRDNPSRKDIADLVMDLHELVEPRKEAITMIDKALTVNLDASLDDLPLNEKLERIRRVLSGD